MKGRAFVTLIGGAAVASALLWLRSGRAQQPAPAVILVNSVQTKMGKRQLNHFVETSNGD